MAGPGEKVRFALDQNYPSPVIQAFGTLVPYAELSAVLAHLSHICHHSKRDRPQVWKLSVAQKDYEEPRAYLEQIAQKSKTTVDDLVRTHKLSAKELRATRS